MKKVWSGVRWLLLLEVRMYVGAVRLLTRRSDVPADAQPFAYAGAVAAPLWAFTGVSAVELVALHLILPWETVRLIADILGIWGVVWCLGMIGCHYVYPHLFTEDALRVRNTHRHDTVRVPWEAVDRVGVRERSLDNGRAVQVEDGVLHVVVGSRTNLELTLKGPLEVTVRGVVHEVREVRLFADESREAVAAVRAHLTSGADRPS